MRELGQLKTKKQRNKQTNKNILRKVEGDTTENCEIYFENENKNSFNCGWA